MIRSIQTLVLVSACYYRSSDNLPDMDFLQNYKSELRKLRALVINKDQDNENKEKLHRWKSIVNSYQGHLIFTDLGYVIMELVKKGYLDEVHYLEAIKKLHSSLNMEGIKQSFDDVWNIYNGSFKNNEDEFIKKSNDVFKQAIKSLDINDLNNLVSVYYDLDREKLANELIDLFAKTKITKNNAAEFIKHILINRNPAVAVKLKEYAYSLLPNISLEDAILYIAEHNGWSNNEADIMLAATEEEYYQLFTSHQGEDLYSLVDTCVNFSFSTEKYMPIIKNSRAALERIAKENNFNRVRILNMYDLDYK